MPGTTDLNSQERVRTDPSRGRACAIPLSEDPDPRPVLVAHNEAMAEVMRRFWGSSVRVVVSEMLPLIGP